MCYLIIENNKFKNKLTNRDIIELYETILNNIKNDNYYKITQTLMKNIAFLTNTQAIRDKFLS